MGRLTRATFLTLAGLAFILPVRVEAQVANEPWEGGNSGGEPPAPISPIGQNQGYGWGSPSWGGAWTSAISPPASEMIFTPGFEKLMIIEDNDADGTVENTIPTLDDLNYLTYTSAEATPFTISSGKRVLRVEGDTDGLMQDFNVLRRPLGSTITDGSLYFAYLIRVEDGEIDTDDRLWFWFDSASTGTHANAPRVGLDMQGGGAGDFFIRLLATGSGGGPQFASAGVADLNPLPPPSVNFAPSATYYVVMKVTRDIGTGRYNDVRLWVNPVTTDNDATADAIITAPTTRTELRTSFTHLGISVENLLDGDVYYIDGPRVGSSFPDVVPPGGTTLIVDLASLTAVRDGGAVTINWQTLSEIDTAGFKVVRANADGTLGQAVTTSLVPSEGSGNSGASYSISDATPASPASYFLIEVELDGSETIHGPVTAPGAAPASSVGNWTLY